MRLRRANRFAKLRKLGNECRWLSDELELARERRDALALELIDDGATWRSVAEAAGFENPYLATLKRNRESARA